MRIFFILCATFALLACLAACDAPPPSGPRVLEWGEAGVGDVARVVDATGVIRVRPGGQIRVGSRLKGQVTELFVRTGDVVRAGQLLAVLDDRELQTQRQAALARLEAARNELERVESQRAKRLEEAGATLDADKNRQAYEARRLERRRQLSVQGHIHQDDLEASRRDEASSTQSVAQGRARLDRVDVEARRDAQRAAKALEEARAKVDEIDAYLSMTRVESPIDGIVGQVHTQKGEQVVAELESVSIVTVIDPRFLELRVYVNEADAAGIRPGMPVRFFQAVRPKEIYGAVIDRVSPSPETVDRILYFPAMASLAPAASLILRPEMTVQCAVLVEDLKGVLSVPAQAVVERGGRRVVYVDDGQGRARPVEPVFGTRGAGRVQVLSGLEPGTRVALSLAWDPQGVR
ncbi:Macrolide export protein MacA [Fundidesulfovibrio magnetotacticus]|uniref:Macrolide export protein MacA n=1 Tax=Fundidesulfovibrio magnetotacticus TaxID=2730080 RepID=A0A6V8LSC5_9BACT|nr:HlyD family efflux transporter periplasmic adaptor subunit [Fundidesulfovibrio magnetotacticus]GFK93471.1 Macrolide export protein MacA [Fundidesulfovibrio magnetotacticus]